MAYSQTVENLMKSLEKDCKNQRLEGPVNEVPGGRHLMGLLVVMDRLMELNESDDSSMVVTVGKLANSVWSAA